VGTTGAGLLSIGSLLHEACSARDVEGRFRTRAASDPARPSVLLIPTNPAHEDRDEEAGLPEKCFTGKMTTNNELWKSGKTDTLSYHSCTFVI
jgi:hypothetical protein